MSRDLLIALLLLSVIFFTGFDSSVLDGLVPLIQREFFISDADVAVIRTTSSTVHTLSLALVWIIGGFFDKRKVITISISSWILSTLASIVWGTRAFWVFVVFRSLNAAATAVFGVLTPVVLADLYKDRALGIALVSLTAAESLYGPIATVFASFVVDNELPWQIGFLPAILLTALSLIGLCLTMRRTDNLTTHRKSAFSSAFGLFTNKSFLIMVIVFSLSTFRSKSVYFWSASLVLSAIAARPQVFLGLSYSVITMVTTVVSFVGSAVGLPSVMWLAQTWQYGSGRFSEERRGFHRAFPIIFLLVAIVDTLSISADIWLKDKSFVGSQIAVFFNSACASAASALCQQMLMMVVPACSRAASISLSRLAAGLVSTPSAQIIGVVSDTIRAESTLEQDKLSAYQLSLLWMSLFVGVVMLLNIVLVIVFPADCQRAEREDGETKPLIEERREKSGSLIESMIRSRTDTIKSFH